MVKQYLDHSREVFTSGRTDFKGGSKRMGLISLFGYQNEYDLREGFPLLTTKKMGEKVIAHELIWFMSGKSNIKYLVDNKVHIWDDNAFDHNLKGMVNEGIFLEGVKERYSNDWHKAKEEYVQRIKEDSEFASRWGDLGPVYGSQWRHWGYIDENGEPKKLDQFEEFIDVLTRKPTSKRNIITAWNPGENIRISQPPCHLLIQSNGNEEGQMDLQLYQRSSDMFLGVPFNIASYAMLTQIVAQQAGLKPRSFIHTFGDTHFYCGDGERSEWYGKNLPELKEAIDRVEFFENYQEVFEWINESAPPERKETKGYDHVTAIVEQLSRKPKGLPKLLIADKPYDELTIDDFSLKGYDPHPAIRRAMAV